MSTATPSSVDGAALRALFAAAMAALERRAEAINAINVFPVPDGDTGTNMLLTMRATLEEAARLEGGAAGAVARAMAHGALMGARGNSGVILSQILRGLASAVDGKRRLHAADLAAALAEGARTAYGAVSEPVEGTILTVVREAAAAAERRARGGASLAQVMTAASAAARRAVEETPGLLPVLAQAGVVDAGGEGLAVMLEGARRYLAGEPLAVAEEPSGRGVAAINEAWLRASEALHQAGEERFAYCTEFIVGGDDLAVEEVRAKMRELGDSILVVGEPGLVRVHLHTADPGAALGYATLRGTVSHVKVENMEMQHRELVHRQRAAVVEAPESLSTVVVAAGPGLQRLFRSLGATVVVEGGQTLNPSVGALVEAIEACPAPTVVLLPNNKNVLLTASQAATLISKEVRVVPSRTIPQGVAAMLALLPDQSAADNARAMEEALGTVRTAEVCPAVRSGRLGGVAFRRGQVIAIIDGELSLATETADEAVLAALQKMVRPETDIITLYAGAEVTDAEAEALAAEVKARYPGREVEVVAGGQPHYFYLVSVE